VRLDPASLQGRVVALGLLVLIAAGSWTLLLQPTIETYQEKHEALARAQRSFLQYQRRTPPLAELEARRDLLKSQQAQETGLLEGANAVIGNAALQAQVRRIFAAQGGAVRSVQALPPVNEAGLQKIAVRVDATLTAEKLLDFLYELEGTVPYLFADALELRASEHASRTGQINGATTLAVRADVSGFLGRSAPP
jgi:hypothetical protein